VGIFSRRRAEIGEATSPPDTASGTAPDGAPDTADAAPAGAPAAAAAAAEDTGTRADGDRGTVRGPWDVTERPALGARLDLGALRVPGLPGMQLRMEMDQNGARAVAANLGYEGSALQVQAFAAPRSYGIWDELRAELASSVSRQGGTADEVPGPFGTELLARLPMRTPEGRTGHRPARFIGVDGPRWFLRGVLTGRAAVEPEGARALEGVFADVVVVRGQEALAPRDLLPLHLPGRGPAEQGGAAEQNAGTEVLRRGPEITEVR
jgi:hypothetical protein